MYNYSDFNQSEKRHRLIVRIIMVILAIVAVGCLVMITVTLMNDHKSGKPAETTTTKQVTTTTQAPTTVAATTTAVAESTTAGKATDMVFKDVDEKVTPKEALNLRNIPDQGGNSKVVAVIYNGDQVRRTGTSDQGWSRVEYNGNVYYCVSSYLSTDLNYKPSSGATTVDDGIQTTFKAANDTVTAKEEVNLRSIPSVTSADSKILGTLKNGQNLQRTGISDNGWSKVLYNGQTVYCVTSYLKVVQ